ncbi:cell wall metabolism sensor histidine kinase WalK [Patescibacteria group bacterium]|nr:cell wall metabolism sensor histidine kinase WalK [Patescibacteria group bacterium]
MFDAARLKLTLWYLLIIMVVSIFFSTIIYRGLVTEIDRVTRIERIRVQGFPQLSVSSAFLDPDIVGELKRRIIIGLALINGMILVGSGILGYFLAGKTLKPIADMIDEQNRFVSDASHELRTPLTSLKTSMEVGLRDKNLDLAGAKSLISESISDVDRLQSLSEGLLQLTQFQQVADNFKLEEVSVKNFVGAAVKRVKVLAKSKNVKVGVDVKDFKVRGNGYSLIDLMVILLDNAIKYSPKGKIIVIKAEKSNRVINILVKDQGVGISKKDLPHIFDRFYRADTARTKSGQGGYGLGLSIAKKIVDIHQGTIRFDSRVGRGTTAVVSLPIFS